MEKEQFKIVCRAYFPNCEFDCFGAHIDLGDKNKAWIYYYSNTLYVKSNYYCFEYKDSCPLDESHLVEYLRHLKELKG